MPQLIQQQLLLVMDKKKVNYYYDTEQEEAVVAFLNAKTIEERTKIYRDHLMRPIEKMVEILIRRYHLDRPNDTYDDIHADAISFLMVKFDKFKPSKNKKSYSYYGTVVKNYLRQELIKADKLRKAVADFDEVETEVLNREDQKYRIDDSTFNVNVFIEQLIDLIKDDLLSDDLSEKEFKVGHALVKILQEYDKLFNDGEEKNSSKFNKNLILLYIRNITGLETKEIRKSLDRFKSLYKIFKNDFIED